MDLAVGLNWRSGSVAVHWQSYHFFRAWLHAWRLLRPVGAEEGTEAAREQAAAFVEELYRAGGP